MAVTINASTSSGLQITSDTSGDIAFQTNGTQYNPTLVSATAQASTSGTAINFTSIPSWVKRITVMFDGVSTSGGSAVLVQIGDSGGIETTGYTSLASGGGTTLQTLTSTSGYVIDEGRQSTATTRQGLMTICNITGNTWVASGVIGNDTSRAVAHAGTKTTSATLDRVRITTNGGTETFDAGTINIMYE